ncbi:hypothetical protein WJX73_003069 [Symbiochloris irregularis]|uniref:Protein kinase domain-containing protein n=1 Tax=Symbiochloris irregularis TaxID=706552 RepID=A0AAW1NMS7_9CHLO
MKNAEAAQAEIRLLKAEVTDSAVQQDRLQEQLRQAQQDLHALHHDYTETLEQVAAYEDAHAGLLQDNASNVSEIQQLKQDQQLQAAQIRNVQGQLCIVQQDKARLEQENARSAATIAFRDTQNKQLEAARRQLSAMLTLQKAQAVRQHEIQITPAHQIDAPQPPNMALAEFSAVDTLGEGGCGLVVRANHADRTIPHEFAIKCAQEDDSDASITTRGRDSLQNEVMVLQSLGRSEYIASMRAVLYLRVDMPVLGRPLGIAFDVCEGGDLFGVLAAHHNAGMPLPRWLIFRCLKQALLGLEHLHSLGYVHADVKPENMLLDRKGTALSVSASFRGTPRYAPAEQTYAPVAVVTQTNDTWSWGASAVALLCPSDMDSLSQQLQAMTRTGFTTSARVLPPQLESPYNHILADCFWIDPGKRPTDSILLDRMRDAERLAARDPGDIQQQCVFPKTLHHYFTKLPDN